MRQNNSYCKLFFSGLINGIGDRFSQVAMLTMLLTLTGSGLSIGVVMMLRLLPFLLFAPIGGRLSDFFPRKRILVITDLGRIVFALSFLLVQSQSEIWIIYLSAFILAVGEAIYSPARTSLVPFSVSKENYGKVNSMEQVMTGIVLIFGALAGGIVTFILGSNIAFWLNGISFLIAALINATIKNENKVENISRKLKGENTYISQIKEVIKNSFPLKLIIIYILLVSLITGIDNILISIYAVKIFHLGEFGVGLFYGALGIGLFCSFYLTSYLRSRFILTGLLCLGLEGTMLVILSVNSIVTLAFIIFCLTAFFSGTCNTCFNTMLMKNIPEQLRGTLFGVIQAVSNTLLAISMFFAGILLGYVSPRVLGFLGGVSFVFISIILFILLISHEYGIRLRKKLRP
ncbi:MFS transporter [Sporolactobacillus shoreae]|uniref:MFS transporter n=1 Tax=Sporolactobacillus shoreae TaxID=1465501 RepID=UPI001F4F57B2|nr:MFS transporter [Sporolactobacillus shoreae]